MPKVNIMQKYKIQTKHHRCEKGAAKALKGFVEKVWNWNGQPRPPAFDSLKILVMMTSLQSIVMSSAQGLLM